ncbi:hypothetical protein [Streptomyces sp. NPDC029003]|uniref:hypothetical protein n=1 Tax=Streptomyces sp. NPDC029003 TaxID=3155125 RepID=UPI0033EF4191
MSLLRTEPDIVDHREFSLIDYRHGHTYAVVRGFPATDDGAPGGSPMRVLDIFFAGVERISCSKDVGHVEVHRAGASERQALAARIGRIRPGDSVFFLKGNSTEDYIIASRMYWAEFDLPHGSMSPLASEDSEYRSANPAVNNIVRFSD